MDEPINWHDLEIFHAVLEQGSFSGAARALGLPPPEVVSPPGHLHAVGT